MSETHSHGAGGVLDEIQRALDAFLALHSHHKSVQSLDSIAQAGSSSDWQHHEASTTFQSDLEQIQWTCGFAAARSLGPVLRLLLSWIHTVDHRPPTHTEAKSDASAVERSLSSWLAARLLVVVLDTATLPAPSPETNDLAAEVLDRCLKIFETEHDLELKRSHPSSPSFFSVFMALKTSSHPPLTVSTRSEGDTEAQSAAIIQRHALGQWRLVFGRAAKLSARTTRSKLQSSLSKPGLVVNVPKMWLGDFNHASIPHPYLQFLIELPLSLVQGVDNQSQRLKDAALLLRVFFPLLSKPFKSRVRRGAAILVSSLLGRERAAMDRGQLQSLLALTPVNEWNSCVSELHAIALKLSQKRKTLASGWELRALVLSLAPPDIFGRYWKDDMHALLRLQYRHSKDGGGIAFTSGSTADGATADSVAGTILRCVGVSFTTFVLRYALTDRQGGSPTESDCMEIINTAQAWCFFSSHRHKSFSTFQSIVVPVLVDLSVAIAAFNMRYAIQSHLRRLLTEADSVVDDKKLVGLKVLLELCSICQPTDSTTLSANRLGFTMDMTTFVANIGPLGEIAGHILILCSTLLGHDLLFDPLSFITAATSPSSLSVSDQAQASTATLRLLRDDNKRQLALEIFSTALRSLEFVYRHLELRSDQKVLLLARASVHSCESIRLSAKAALLAVASSPKVAQAGAIVRGLTDFLVRMTSNHAQASDTDPVGLLVRLCGSLLSAAVRGSLRVESTGSCWEDNSRVRESFLQVEAASVFLLTHDQADVRLAALETLEEVQTLRVLVVNGLDPQLLVDSQEHEIVNALDVIEALEPALQDRFFTFQPGKPDVQGCQSSEGASKTKLRHFRSLAGDWSDGRHAFRWSMCLALVLPALAAASPQLMTYFWTDVNDKVSKLEPVVSTVNDGHTPRLGSTTGSNLSRWRNLSIFATASACRTLVLAGASTTPQSATSTTQNAIATTAIAALLKRLGRYLKSTSMEQQKAAVVALGATHGSSLSLLVDTLSRCEADAFVQVVPDQGPTDKASSRTDSFGIQPASQQQSVTSPSTSVSRRYSKYAVNTRGSRVTSPLQTRWAILRLYRLLLERVLAASDSTLSGEDELLLSATSSYLVRIANALDQLYTGAGSTDRTSLLLGGADGYLLFMVQQDFSGAVQLLLKHLMKLERGGEDRDNNEGETTSVAEGEEHPETQAEPSTIASYVTEERSAQWTKSLLTWCASFGSLADSALAEHLDGVFFSATSPLHHAWATSCDVFGVREREMDEILPWLWLDDAFPACIKLSGNQDASAHRFGQPPAAVGASSTRFLRLFTCQSAFSTLITLIESSQSHFLASDLVSRQSPVFSWLDECFAVDTSRVAAHFSVLQRLCRLAVTRFLESDRDRGFRSICIDKASFCRSSGAGHTIAKQYMLSLTSQARRVSVELLDTSISISNLLRTADSQAHYGVQAVYALLLHLGTSSDPADYVANDLHRATIRDFVGDLLPRGSTESDQARRWLSSLAVTVPRHSVVLATEVRNRIQAAAASALASSFPGLRFAVCVAVFSLLDGCDVVIQRSMLGAVLPLLVDTKPSEVPSSTSDQVAGVAPIDALLDAMFKLTMSISDTCVEQLDRAWLTLAYSSTCTSIDASLLTIVTFLVKKSRSPKEAATAKLVLWWLSRWQDAAFRVLSIFCGFVEAQRLPRRTHSTSASDQETAKTSSMDGIAMLVTLMSDASCHLQQSDSSAFKEVVVQSIHYALLLHFALQQSVSGGTWRCSGSSGDPQLEEMSGDLVVNMDIRRDCVVLLQTLMQFLASSTTPEALVTVMDATTSCIDGHLAPNGIQSFTMAVFQRQSPAKRNVDGDSARPFLDGVKLIVQSISTEDALVWADVCVKEIALVLSSVTNSPSLSKLTTSAAVEARFAVLMYGFLASEFNGDVLLAVLELLHVALDENLRASEAFEPLICDCLAMLARMLDLTPDAKLALYPQVLWVCTALLNHFTTANALQSTLELVHSLLHKPVMVTNEILVDVILSKRPSQWSSGQSSILRALVPNVHIGDERARQVAIKMAAHCVLLLPRPLLSVTEAERAVLCSIGLLPAIVSQFSSLIVSSEVVETACKDLAAQWEALAAPFGVAEASQTGGEAVLDVAKYFEDQANEFSHRRPAAKRNVPATLSSREAISAFVAVFMPALAALTLGRTPLVDGLALTFDVISRTLSRIDSTASDSASNETTSAMADMDDGVFILAEELLLVKEATGVRWSPPQAFNSALSRIVRTPRRQTQWQSAVRLLAFVSLDSAPSTS